MMGSTVAVPAILPAVIGQNIIIYVRISVF
jgi:hypothetical protein